MYLKKLVALAQSFAVRPLGKSSRKDARDLQEYWTSSMGTGTSGHCNSGWISWLLFAQARQIHGEIEQTSNYHSGHYIVHVL